MRTNAITGFQVPLLHNLRQDLQGASGVKIIVSFLMESGVRLLVEDLAALAQSKKPILILTGRYLNVTEPPALYLLKHALGDQADIRFYADTTISFHPKAYLIEKQGGAVLYIGSSNVSRSALVGGVEWNYRLERSQAPVDYAAYEDMFDQLFGQATVVTDDVLRDYAVGWRRTLFNTNDDHAASHKASPLVLPFPDGEERDHSNEGQPVNQAAEAVEGYVVDPTNDYSPVVVPSNPVWPRGAQTEALYCLDVARKEGICRGLVVVATGVGKTYLAAFDSRPFKRVLFIAHLEEILHQAADSFRSVRPTSSIGFFSGLAKDNKTDLVFATVQTLGRSDYLSPEWFDPGDFDYIVIDEFHHAAADTYGRVLDYFRPKFLLGLTATPYRMDNRDIMALCDDNIIYEMPLGEAINRGYLVPFYYYAFYDETDYSAIDRKIGRYDLEQLEEALSYATRLDLVLSKYQQFAGKRTLGFCATIQHAERMADFFASNGILTAVTHSGAKHSPLFLPRQEAIQALLDGTIRVLFVVDLFNEGVDLPSVDTVLFLRPTESYVVFLQQLGRGLRQATGKAVLAVLDFIGNYKHAHYIPMLLAGQNPFKDEGARDGRCRTITELELPQGCSANFDFRLIDLFQEMRKRDPLEVRLRDEYWRLKDVLGRRPTRLDVFEGSDIPISKYLGHDGWLGFLASVDQLTDEEQAWRDAPVAKVLQQLEQTSMSKSYKIPTVLAFLSGGTVLRSVGVSELAASWREYYGDTQHAKDMDRDKSSRGWRNWSDEQLANLAIRNPVKYLSNTPSFRYDEINRQFHLDVLMDEGQVSALAVHLRDILTWRSRAYFGKRYRPGEG